MLVRLLEIILLLTQVVAQVHEQSEAKCKRSLDSYCGAWGRCSSSCGGTRSRTCRLCPQESGWTETETCRLICKYGKLGVSGCVCPEWRSGNCCEACRHIHIDHCVPNQQACGGSPDGIKCTQCYDPYYPAGYGKGCQECGIIKDCNKRSCTEPSNTRCLECENNNVFFKLTTSNTKCERMCSFNNHYCWPGVCSDGLAKNCVCANFFEKSVTGDKETSCQPTQLPVIETCKTVATGSNGEKRTSSAACKNLDSMYGNYQATQISAEMVSSYLVDVRDVTRPTFIYDERFGITDTTIYLERKLFNGVNRRLTTHRQLTDTSDSSKATSSYRSTVNIKVQQHLNDGEALCVIFEAYGGGYLKHVNVKNEPRTVSSPVPYRKKKTSREVCYRFDSSKPQHCQETGTCHTEPIAVQARVTRSQISTVSFGGWFDPTPAGGKQVQVSGIESYKVIVNEVLPTKEKLKVHTGILFNKTVDESVSRIVLNLASDRPRLYSVTLEVKDVAKNTRQARRFMLYDNTSYIETAPENHFRVVSASKQSNFTWQTHHQDICLSWKDHFQNRFYLENALLNPIEPDPHGQISGVYEQLTGVLPVSGTQHVYGITKFLFSSSLNGGKFSTETEILDFLNQSYCKDFKVKDGETYTLRVRPVDIASNTFSENRTVHVDRSAPHINNIWLRKDGNNTLYVQHVTDLSTMHLYFETSDPHSGIRNVEWAFGNADFGKELMTGSKSVQTLLYTSCPKNIIKCYCPDVGNCEFLNYSVPLGQLVAIINKEGNYRQNYSFTVKATNHASLTNIEIVDFFVDESPPEPSVIYEEKNKTPNTAIIAAGVSSVGVIVIIVILLIFLWTKRQKKLEKGGGKSQINTKRERARENDYYNISRSKRYETIQRKDGDIPAYVELSQKTEKNNTSPVQATLVVQDLKVQLANIHLPDEPVYENLKLTVDLRR